VTKNKRRSLVIEHVLSTLGDFLDTFSVHVHSRKVLPETIKKLINKQSSEHSKILITLVTSDKNDLEDAVVLIKFSEFLDMYERREMLEQALG